MWNPFKKKQKVQKPSPVHVSRPSQSVADHGDSSLDILQTVILMDAFNGHRDTSPAPEAAPCHDYTPSYSSASSESSYSSDSYSGGSDSCSCGGDSGGGGGGD